MNSFEKSEAKQLLLSDRLSVYEPITAPLEPSEYDQIYSDFNIVSNLNSSAKFTVAFMYHNRYILSVIKMYVPLIKSKYDIEIDPFEFWWMEYADQKMINIVNVSDENIKDSLVRYAIRITKDFNNGQDEENPKPLKNRQLKIYEYESLFSDSMKLQLTTEALKHFNFINEEGEYVNIHPGYFAAFIKVLRDNNVVIDVSQEVLQRSFCEKLGIPYKRMKYYSKGALAKEDVYDKYIKSIIKKHERV